MKPKVFRATLTDPLGSPVAMALLGLGLAAGSPYATVTRVVRDHRPARLPRNYAGHRAHCNSREAKKGRTNGLPWDGTSPVSAPTEIDPKRSRPSRKAGMGKRQQLRGETNV